MFKSMTGYGASRKENPELQVNVEIKTLNSKFLDVSIKLPKQLTEKEIEIRNLIADKLVRGKVNLLIEYQKKVVDTTPIAINEALFKQYYTQFESLAKVVGLENPNIFDLAVQSPEVMIPQIDNPEIEEDFAFIKTALLEAIDHCNQFRIAEGDGLKDKLIEYTDNISALLASIEPFEKERIEIVKERLRANLNDLMNDTEFDQNRFEQELIYYLEKLDITEEKVRLKSHLEYFQQVVTGEGPHGKKLNFVSQEIGREINTMGSKANHAKIQKIVIEMKEELEKIKEQALNII